MKKIYIIIILAIIGLGANAQTNYTVGIWHVINFDTSYKYIHIDTSGQNIWQVGIPQKTYFNSSYSPSRAIVTDTVNDYPVNNYSYFDLYIGNFNISTGVIQMIYILISGINMIPIL